MTKQTSKKTKATSRLEKIDDGVFYDRAREEMTVTGPLAKRISAIAAARGQTPAQAARDALEWAFATMATPEEKAARASKGGAR